MARNRPVRQPALSADPVQYAVKLQEQRVGTVPEEREPLRVEDHAVELVPMKDQELSSVGGLVDRLVDELDAAEVEADIAAERFVMVAGHVDDSGAVLGLLQHAADDVVVPRRPVPALPQLPS